MPAGEDGVDILPRLVAETNKALTMHQARSPVLSIVMSLKPSNSPLPWEWILTLSLYRWAH